MKANKPINMKFTPREIARGEWGHKFYISTFRFPIKDAQAFERRALSMKMTMSSLVNQLVTAFNKSVSEPKETVKLVRTAQPTIWGAVAKKKFFKKLGKAVPVKRAAVKAVKAKAPKVAKKVATKAKTVAKKVTATKPTKKVETKKTSALSVLARLKSLRKNEAA